MFVSQLTSCFFSIVFLLGFASQIRGSKYKFKPKQIIPSVEQKNAPFFNFPQVF
jgi:hypothetical protein